MTRDNPVITALPPDHDTSGGAGDAGSSGCFGLSPIELFEFRHYFLSK